MDVFVDLCQSLGLPVWIAALLQSAKRLRSDHSRRKKAYRLLQRKLISHRVGVKDKSLPHQHQPTYVYPEEVKMLIRSAFPKDICGHPDPNHDEVVHITLEDLWKMEGRGSV
ncbi:hypothetical protein FQA47_018442 [Oryzias melastigma]|uniref:Uncharacterized protein n=1 Tax=Oryzias melastigma TaxID=30732 RepID=A0A834C3E9_ORYME|nr:hypothetical protein FQA47_018442 [Oryzias melastigma]